MYVPLDDVWRGWTEPRGRGLHQLQTAGEHCHVYQDVFGGLFRPLGFLNISYANAHSVAWGNLIVATDALNPPTVTLQSEQLPPGYASLVLTNPDGHLLDNTKDLLHWMM